MPGIETSVEYPEIARLRADLAAEREAHARLRDAIDSIPDACAPGCDSYGHADGCRTYDPAAVIERLQADLARVTEERDNARGHLNIWRAECEPLLAELTGHTALVRAPVDYARALTNERDEARAEVARLYEVLDEMERSCPCGARLESPRTYPHVIGCPVLAALQGKAEGENK